MAYKVAQWNSGNVARWSMLKLIESPLMEFFGGDRLRMPYSAPA